MHSIIHIGAGQAAELDEWWASGAERIVLVEPNPNLAEQLRRSTSREPRVTVVEAAITTNPANNQLHEYNLPQASSLYEATALTSLFPGLKLQARHRVDVMTPQQLMAEHGPQEGEAGCYLRIHTPGEEHAILESLMEDGSLQHVSQLQVTASAIPINADTPGFEQTLQALQDYGFEPLEQKVGEEETSDPDWPTWTLRLSPLKRQLDRLQQEHSRLMAEKDQSLARQKKKLDEQQESLSAQQAQLSSRDDQLASLTKAHDKLQEENEQRNQQLEKARQALADSERARAAVEQGAAEQQQLVATVEAERDKWKQEWTDLRSQLEEETNGHQQAQEKLKETHTWFMNRKRQAEEQAEQLASLTKAHDKLQEENEQQARQLAQKDPTIAMLTEQLTSQQRSVEQAGSRFSELEAKLERLFDEQRGYIQHTTNALGQHVTRSGQRQRDEHALAYYLEHGHPPAATNLPAGLAIALLDEYHRQRYDVMVVMGSPEVTSLLAQAVFSERRNKLALTDEPRSSSDGRGRHLVAPSGDDLPQAILSFEHQRAGCEKLEETLSVNGHRGAVNIQHAPWIDAHQQPAGHLTYACERYLQQLSQWLEPEAKVLVVVGEALADAGHSRAAILQQLLQQLPGQPLDIVVKGKEHGQERELAPQWEALLEARQRPFSRLELPAALGLRVGG